MFSFSVVDEECVCKIVLSIGQGKATGLDSMPAKFLRDGIHQIKAPLTHIINLTIHHGEIPADLRMARVVPLHKKNSKTDVGNFRPVLVLSVISKVLERVIYNQLEVYLKENHLCYDHQSGFCPSFLTDMFDTLDRFHQETNE